MPPRAEPWNVVGSDRGYGADSKDRVRWLQARDWTGSTPVAAGGVEHARAQPSHAFPYRARSLPAGRRLGVLAQVQRHRPRSLRRLKDPEPTLGQPVPGQVEHSQLAEQPLGHLPDRQRPLIGDLVLAELE